MTAVPATPIEEPIQRLYGVPVPKKVVSAVVAVVSADEDTIRASALMQHRLGDEPAWRFLYKVADELVEIATRAGRLGTIDSRKVKRGLLR